MVRLVVAEVFPTSTIVIVPSIYSRTSSEPAYVVSVWYCAARNKVSEDQLCIVAVVFSCNVSPARYFFNACIESTRVTLVVMVASV